MAKKALLVGINNYSSCPLQGCVPDVNNIKQRLLTQGDLRFSFQESDITMLTDSEAITTNWKSALQSFVSGVKPGDILYYHYSGHGATSGDCELTGFQNCTCPQDFNFSPEKMITDLYYHQLFSTLPNGVLFFWCSDSCHSANLDRDLDYHKKFTPRLFKGSVHQTNHGMRTVYPPLPNIALMSGCMLNQTSADGQDDSGNPAGAFSWNLLKALSALPVNTPWTSICAKTNVLLRAGGYNQNPQTDGGLQNRAMNQ